MRDRIAEPAPGHGDLFAALSPADGATRCTRTRAAAPALRPWRWATLPPYNGFTHDERVRAWQLGHWLTQRGYRERPTRCCVSGSAFRVTWHSESYYDWQPYALSQPVHLALHRRFRFPGAWAAIVECHAMTGDEWFARLSPVPVDMAATLRAEHGPAVADLFGRAVRHFPDLAATLARSDWSER